MSLPNFVDEVLDWLDTYSNGGNYRVTEFSPPPVRVNRDESTRLDTGEHTKSVDLAMHNVVGVSSAPTQSNTIIGTDFDYRVRAGVSVRIEAVSESEAYADGDGGVADSDEFLSLVGEVRHAILAERVRPTSDPNILYCTIESENNNSPGSKDYYRYDFDVWFHGYETLP